MSSLAQLRVQYTVRSRGNLNTRLAVSRNATSEQLLMVPTAYIVAKRLRMLARRIFRRTGWFLDMKYQDRAE